MCLCFSTYVMDLICLHYDFFINVMYFLCLSVLYSCNFYVQHLWLIYTILYSCMHHHLKRAWPCFGFWNWLHFLWNDTFLYGHKLISFGQWNQILFLGWPYIEWAIKISVECPCWNMTWHDLGTEYSGDIHCSGLVQLDYLLIEQRKHAEFLEFLRLRSYYTFYFVYIPKSIYAAMFPNLKDHLIHHSAGTYFSGVITFTHLGPKTLNPPCPSNQTHIPLVFWANSVTWTETVRFEYLWYY